MVWLNPDRRRFFYDSEFMERQGSLELISIGIVTEDRQTLYLCNSEADFTHANEWVAANVIPLLPSRADEAWCTRAEIAARILDFIKPAVGHSPVEMWGYFSDYDHVLLCWLYGAMIDLPKGMPMATMDIKQLAEHLGGVRLPKLPNHVAHDALTDALWCRDMFTEILKPRADLAWDVGGKRLDGFDLPYRPSPTHVINNPGLDNHGWKVRICRPRTETSCLLQILDQSSSMNWKVIIGFYDKLTPIHPIERKRLGTLRQPFQYVLVDAVQLDESNSLFVLYDPTSSARFVTAEVDFIFEGEHENWKEARVIVEADDRTEFTTNCYAVAVGEHGTEIPISKEDLVYGLKDGCMTAYIKGELPSRETSYEEVFRVGALAASDQSQVGTVVRTTVRRDRLPRKRRRLPPSLGGPELGEPDTDT